eukprot:TRINITY_DN52550_c0_g1_i1.p1 TRINITY_DN52550_c0_g1~~TRINITY_DN52550_c0_g1_i1.p1  ORF type:complete len:101 (-),score=4.57 TRINITY_DN52550_c0_g1_i1:278-580(-)
MGPNGPHRSGRHMLLLVGEHSQAKGKHLGSKWFKSTVDPDQAWFIYLGPKLTPMDPGGLGLVSTSKKYLNIIKTITRLVTRLKPKTLCSMHSDHPCCKVS